MATLVDFANQLRERIDIVDVVSRYVKLRRAGANWKGLCPFHREKTPSFTVSQPKQIFHCFGCHKGGDVFRFVELIEHVEWKDAVRLLAEKYGVPLPTFQRASREGGKDVRQILYEINELACCFFTKILIQALNDSGHTIAAYLKSRRIDLPTVEKFRLGLAPAEWTRLVDEIRRAGYQPEHALAAGVALRHEESGRVYDRFRSRLMFPICDNLGRPIAFGGRVYLPDASPDQPKYVNSPETELYKKGQFLYGFHLAKEAIAREGYAILVEGYFDAIRAHQHGFCNTVASCGTALTAEQARSVRRLCDRVVFVYDGDEAGQQAMLRGCQILLEQEFSVGIVVLPENHDPDSFLLERGAEAFRSQIQQAKDFYDFFLDRAIQQFGLSSVQAKVQVFNFLRPILAKISNAIALDAYLIRTAQILGTEISSLRRELVRGTKETPLVPAPATLLPKQYGHPVERYVLKVCVEREDLQFELLKRIQPEWLNNSMISKWYAICRDRILDGLSVEWSELLALCEDPDGEDAQFLREVMLDDREPLSTINETVIENVASRLQRDYLIGQNRQLIEICRTLYPEDPEGERWINSVEQMNANLGAFKEATRGCRPPRDAWRNTA
jgi:DNA primase